MKTPSITTSEAILTVTALGIITANPIVLGIAFLGFCVDNALNQALRSSIEDSLALQDIQIAQLEDQLAAKK
jgi:hypothetical protein